jgi:hypothetical protein
MRGGGGHCALRSQGSEDLTEKLHLPGRALLAESLLWLTERFGADDPTEQSDSKEPIT